MRTEQHHVQTDGREFREHPEGGAVAPVALTAADASTVDVTYGTEEAAVINNLRTRLGELETQLQALGILS